MLLLLFSLCFKAGEIQWRMHTLPASILDKKQAFSVFSMDTEVITKQFDL